MAQLMPLPLSDSCFSKIQIGSGTGSHPVSGERLKVIAEGCKMDIWCCVRGVGNNSIQSTSYQKWVHKKYGIKGSMSKEIVIYL